MRPRGLHRLARVLGKRATLGAMSTIACAVVLAACGEDDELEPSIPADRGTEIVDALERVRDRVESGDCDGAEATAQSIRDAISALPAEVPDELQQALVQGSDNLISQTREQCEPAEEDPPPEPETGASGEEGVVP